MLEKLLPLGLLIVYGNNIIDWKLIVLNKNITVYK